MFDVLFSVEGREQNDFHCIIYIYMRYIYIYNYTVYVSLCVYQMFIQFKKKRICHFDIKPQNILFTTQETGNHPRN